MHNPNGIPHGCAGSIRHTGDMCNNIVSIDQVAEYTYTDKLISLVDGDPANIINMFVVVHEDKDDCGDYEQYNDPYLRTQSRITGNAGNRLAYARIASV